MKPPPPPTPAAPPALPRPHPRPAAGRGPVLGPMVYGCAYWPLSEDEEIKKFGFDDSKALTEARRESLFDKMQACGRIGWVTISIGADDISHKMLRRVPVSLNAISHDAAADLVRRVLDAGVNVTQVFVDTVGDAATYQNKLTRLFQHRIAFTVSKKADSLFKTVSAASIAAKVTRDRALRHWVFDEPALAGIGAAGAGAGSSSSSSAAAAPADDDFSDGADDVEDADEATPQPARKRQRAADDGGGSSSSSAAASSSSSSTSASLHPSTAGSGYPGDPATKAWLRKHLDAVFGWPSVMRFSWSTSKDMLEKDATPVEWEEEASTVGGPGGAPPAPDARQTSLGAFFSASSSSSSSSSSAAGGGAGAGGAAAAARPGQRHAFFRRRHMELVAEL
jgi:ribonuclease H2 subunit A